MSLFEYLFQIRNRRLVARWSAEIAQRSAPLLIERVAATAAPMSPAEARGYIRARAVHIVHDQVMLAIAQEPSLSERLQQQLFDEATERVVELVRTNLPSGVHRKPSPRRAA